MIYLNFIEFKNWILFKIEFYLNIPKGTCLVSWQLPSAGMGRQHVCVSAEPASSPWSGSQHTCHSFLGRIMWKSYWSDFIHFKSYFQAPDFRTVRCWYASIERWVPASLPCVCVTSSIRIGASDAAPLLRLGKKRQYGPFPSLRPLCVIALEIQPSCCEEAQTTRGVQVWVFQTPAPASTTSPMKLSPPMIPAPCTGVSGWAPDFMEQRCACPSVSCLNSGDNKWLLLY